MWFLKRRKRAEQHRVVVAVHALWSWEWVVPHTFMKVPHFSEYKWTPAKYPKAELVVAAEHLRGFVYKSCRGHNCPTT